jgi:membrane protein DedA with SNARE-associated domain
MAFDTNLTHVFETLSYAGLFLWLVMYNLLFFVPLPPPEIILVTVGYISSLGHINPFIAGGMIVLTFWLSDIAFYLLTLRGNKLAQKIIQKFGGQKTYLRFKTRMEKNPFRILILLTFIPTVRSLAPIISGSLKLSWKKFFLYTLLANSILSAAYISLGFVFHKTIIKLTGELTILEHIIFYPVLILIVAMIIILVRKHFIERKSG